MQSGDRPNSASDLEALLAAADILGNGSGSGAFTPNSSISRRISLMAGSSGSESIQHHSGHSNISLNTSGVFHHRLSPSPHQHRNRLSWGSQTKLPGVSLEEGDVPSLVLPPKISASNRASTFNSHSTSLASGAAASERFRKAKIQSVSRIFDDPAVTAGYASVPWLDREELPRGGVSVETAAVGRVQYGIPPETIKDSMVLGLPVPRVYIVPTDRFCTTVGPALGINLAEFEFPAYFNWFVRQKRCCLVVDSDEAEENIRNVFEETLLGPRKFRDRENPIPNDDEDFDPDYPVDARPNFYKEFEHFRVAEKTDEYEELTTDMLLEFVHFRQKIADTDSFKSADNRNRTDEKGSSGAFVFQNVNGDIGVPPMEGADESYDNFDDDVSLEDFANSAYAVKMVGDTKPDSVNLLHASTGTMRLPSRDSEAIEFRKTRLNDSVNSTRSTTTAPISKLQSSHPNLYNKSSRRSSLESVESGVFSCGSSANTFESMLSDEATTHLRKEKDWMFSQIQWLGQVATIWPMDATPVQIRERTVPRVEIFRMPGSGTEYVIHDVNAENVIVGKARIRGTVKIPEQVKVEGFIPTNAMKRKNENNDSTKRPFVVDQHGEHSASSFTDGISSVDQEDALKECVFYPLAALTTELFYPPSFGVTVLGNSHGFDKNGSTSGYVLWINGRGIMIDPPPFSSATLEREGIRPQMIFGVMITHCHADHDAGAFQKMLTGSRLTVITTPTIYTSFIRKYSALSGLSPTLLQHSHRFRPALIGQPLKFQGAVFHFTYTLHTIPCISFKVEWRGRSMVFTGDHLNLPPLLDELEAKGVLLKARADSLREMPLQDCDVLLHEAGAPPIHTPLSVLQSLPEDIKKRLYVVHTTALPPDSGLRVAPTGTAGTIRLDGNSNNTSRTLTERNCSISLNTWNSNSRPQSSLSSSEIPKVLRRPACISDAWFMLNLISNIPFFGSLSYTNTMEVLELASIDVFSTGETVLPARKRASMLCVIWEGTCVENCVSEAIWHAGDWTGPLALQPNVELSAQSDDSTGSADIIALSKEGVKVITLIVDELHKILMRGSNLYRNYIANEAKRMAALASQQVESSPTTRSVLDCLKINSVLGNLYPRQSREIESLADGPRVFEPGTFLWKAGNKCDYAFLIAAGSASFRPPPVRQGSMNHAKTLSSYRQQSSRHILDTGDGNFVELDKMLHSLPPESEFSKLEIHMAIRSEKMEADPDYRSRSYGHTRRELQVKQSDRNSNNVFARLYTSRKCIDGLVVSRGCFLSDTSKMVSGDLVQQTGGSSSKHVHSSTLIVGPSGCVAWVFPRANIMPFLDANPGVLLGLLGTQVVL